MLAVMLGACSSTGGSKKTTAAVSEGSGSGGNSEVSTYGAGEGAGSGMSELDDPNSPLSTRIVYFEYDSSEIQERYREVVAAHADYLVKNPNVVVSLEGHADERGSR
jgi:peptidoglycan-associated lipoprotein